MSGKSKNNVIFIISSLLIIIIFSASQIICCTNLTGDFLKNNNKNNSPHESNDLGYLAGEEISLPEPDLDGNISLEEAMSKRRSIRIFTSREIEIKKISQLMWAAQGITKNPEGYRTAPSAGALYPIEVFLSRKDGIFHYKPEKNKLLKLKKDDLRQSIYKACLSQKAVAEADVIIIITAVYERTTLKYGERGIRYVHLEAGHVCQNILLEATVLDLGAVPIGAFDDTRINEITGLPPYHIPLYIIPVGYPE
jgi:SagB-type dehydrogenase family enzyme